MLPEVKLSNLVLASFLMLALVRFTKQLAMWVRKHPWLAAVLRLILDSLQQVEKHLLPKQSEECRCPLLLELLLPRAVIPLLVEMVLSSAATLCLPQHLAIPMHWAEPEARILRLSAAPSSLRVEWVQSVVKHLLPMAVHYQILVQCGRYEIEIQNTVAPTVGDTVGLIIQPSGIHVMKKKFRVNKFTGVITKRNTVEFGDGEFECDVTQLYPNSRLDEEGYLITAKGEKLDLTDTEVNVEVGLHDITMSDNEDEGGAKGNIISLIYKSEYYRYIVRTENEEDYVLACEDLWNENDRVSLIIPKEKIRLTLKTNEGGK